MASIQDVALRHGPGFVAGFALAFGLFSLTTGPGRGASRADDHTVYVQVQSPDGTPSTGARSRASDARDGSARYAAATANPDRAGADNIETVEDEAGDERVFPILTWAEVSSQLSTEDYAADQVFNNIDALTKEIAGDQRLLKELARAIETGRSENTDLTDALLQIAERLPDTDRLQLATSLTRSPGPTSRTQALELMLQTEYFTPDAETNLTELITRETDPDVLLTALNVAEVHGSGDAVSVRRAVEAQATNALNDEVRRQALISLARMGRPSANTQYLIESNLRSDSEDDIEAGLEAVQAAINLAPPDEADRLRAGLSGAVNQIANNEKLSARLRASALALTE